jgi:hypothetical protein
VLIVSAAQLLGVNLAASSELEGPAIWKRGKESKAKTVRFDLVSAYHQLAYLSTWVSFLDPQGNFFSGEDHDIVAVKTLNKIYVSSTMS